AVTASPDQPALVFGRSVTTGGRLDAAANRLARRLREAGVGAGSLVPVCAERSPEQVVAVLAVLKAGGAYAPLDAGLPSGRRASMLADLSPTVVLVQRRLAPAVPPTGGAALLEIEPAWDESLERRHETPPLPAPGDLAYVMFTSGSTGAPKGVMVPHRAIVNRLRWAQERYPIRPGERVLHNSSFGFDIAVWELFGPLLAGGAVVL